MLSLGWWHVATTSREGYAAAISREPHVQTCEQWVEAIIGNKLGEVVVVSVNNGVRRRSGRGQVPLLHPRRGREEHRVEEWSPAQLRRRQQALRGREDAGVARGVSGGEGAAAAQELGDGARPQGAPRGPEDRQLRQIYRQHQRDEGSDPGGGDGHRRLQQLPAHHAAAGAPHLRPGQGDARVVHGHLPHGLPARIRHRGARRLQRPAQDRVQVPALGIHGGAIQGAPAPRTARRVLRRLHLPC